MTKHEQKLLLAAKTLYNTMDFWAPENMPDFPKTPDAARLRACSLTCHSAAHAESKERTRLRFDPIALVRAWDEDDAKHGIPGFRMSNVTWKAHAGGRRLAAYKGMPYE